ncbi:MAG: hypothetical protein ACMXYE_02445 [Candidatus Woesearchaeota archaeon]
MFNKKGFFMSFRDWLSFGVGGLLILLGGLPLLHTFGVLPFGLPGIFNTLMVSIGGWIIALAGLYIVIDGMIEPSGHSLHMILLALGGLFILVGLLPILNSFGVVDFQVPFLENLVVFNIIITVEGFLLILGGLTMR